MIKKIRNAIIAINTFFLMLPAKLSGSYAMEEYLYGVSKPETIEPENDSNIWTILKIILIPLILLIGCIIYIKKSKSSRSVKIAIVSLAIICVVTILGIWLCYKYILN